MESYFFKDDKMPYIESRYDTVSDACYIKHSHNTVSIGANEDGPTELTCKDTICRLDLGALLLINPFEVHCCNPIKKQARTYHMMFLDPNWCYEIQKHIFNNEVKEFIPFKRTILASPKLYDEYIEVNKFLFSNSFYIEKEERLIMFLSKLFEKECSFEESNIDNDNKEVEKIKNFIDENIDANITLLEISNEVNINQYKIIRLFNKTVYLTPHAYLMNAKINRAKELIKDGLSLSEVCYSLNFFDQSHFTKCFKRVVAVTPKQYQDRILHRLQLPYENK